MFLINTPLGLYKRDYLVFNESAVIAPVNANNDIPKKVSGRERVVCMRYPAKGAEKVIPMFWQKVTMLNPVPAKFEGKLSAGIVMTMGGTMAAAIPNTITDKSNVRSNAKAVAMRVSANRIEPQKMKGFRLPDLSEAQPKKGTNTTAAYMRTLAKMLASKGLKPLNS